MDFGTEKSIKEMLERAREEKIRILHEISYLLEKKLPQVLKFNEKILDNSASIAKTINVRFNLDNKSIEISNIVETISKRLIILKENIQRIEINEDSLMQDANLNDAQIELEEIDKVIEKLTINFLTLNRKNLIANYEQKQQLQDKRQKLQFKRAFLEGKMEFVKKQKMKETLKNEIEEIDAKIGVLDEEISEFDFKEEPNLEEQFLEREEK